MIYMAGFWSLMLVLMLWRLVLSRFIKWSKDDISMQIIILASSFLMVAIATRDPIFSAWGVPTEFEWIVGGAIAGFTSWRYYFNPLKDRVLRNEKDVVALKTDVGSIKGDLAPIKNHLARLDRDVARLEVGFESMRDDIRLIKDKILSSHATR